MSQAVVLSTTDPVARTAVSRLEVRRAEAMQVSDETTYRTWRLFMAASVYGFEGGSINVNQTLLAKPDAGRCELPLTRADLYADD